MRESKVEAHFVAVVKRIGGEQRKVKWIGRHGAPDRFVMLPAPDRFGLHPCRQVWAELKRPGLSAEDHQQREHDRMRAFGCEVVVLDTIEKIDEFFQPYLERVT